LFVKIGFLFSSDLQRINADTVPESAAKTKTAVSFNR